MKKKIFLLTTILSASAMLFLSSCLKDKSHYVNFGQSGTWVNFPKGGPSNFGAQAITESGDTVTRVFAVNVASPELQTVPTTVTYEIGGQATVDAYNATESTVVYKLLPASAYKLYATSTTIPAKQLFGYDSISIYKPALDPTQSYMLPITIKSTTNGKLTGNLNTYYIHIIGNDFAGNYSRLYTRWSKPDTTGSLATSDAGHPVPETSVIALPISPTEFEIPSYYYTQLPYHVSFTKTGLGAAARYSNFQVFFTADEKSYYWGTTITLGSGPFFNPNSNLPKFDPTASYTYEQALSYFRFYYVTATRAIIDEYKHE